jgi:hypothetical protein
MMLTSQKLQLLVTLLVLSVVLPMTATAKDSFASPEDTLAVYIDSLRKADSKRYSSCFPPHESHKTLKEKHKIDSYRIIEKITDVATMKRNLTRIYDDRPSDIKHGDVELIVGQVSEAGQEEVFSYWFSRFGTQWKLIEYGYLDPP